MRLLEDLATTPQGNLHPTLLKEHVPHLKKDARINIVRLHWASLTLNPKLFGNLDPGGCAVGDCGRALHYVVGLGHLEAARLLVAAGADVNAVEREGSVSPFLFVVAGVACHLPWV